MSTDTFTDRLEADLFHPESWWYRLQTMLLFGGTLCVGVFFGLRWAAVDTINYFVRTEGQAAAVNPTPAALVSIHNNSMRLALALAFLGLVGGFAIWAIKGD